MDSAVQRKAPEIMTPLMPGRGERFTAVKHSSAEQKDYLGGEDPAWDWGVLVYLSAAGLCLGNAVVTVRILLVQ